MKKRGNEGRTLHVNGDVDDLSRLQKALGNKDCVVFIGTGANGCNSLMRFLVGVAANGDRPWFGFFDITRRHRQITMLFVTARRDQVDESKLAEFLRTGDRRGPVDQAKVVGFAACKEDADTVNHFCDSLHSGAVVTEGDMN
jgi:hypothetical protein